MVRNNPSIKRKVCRYKCKYSDFISYHSPLVFKHLFKEHTCQRCLTEGSDLNNHICQATSFDIAESFDINPWKVLESVHLGIIQSFYIIPNQNIEIIESIFKNHYSDIKKLLHILISTHKPIKFQAQLIVKLTKPAFNDSIEVYLNSNFFILFHLAMLNNILHTQVNQIILRLNNFNLGSNWYIETYEKLVINTAKYAIKTKATSF